MTDPDSARLERLYRQMLRMRRFDERVKELSVAKKIPGYAHTYIGSEAIAAGVSEALRRTDWIASTYRCHGHAIGKGADMRAMAAELYGRRTGTAKGKGGSMHISDFAAGMLGAFGIVAAGMPVALGAALSAQMRGRDDVAVAYFGDGAVHQGVFHEAMGLAKLWNAPVIMVCENNQYAEATAVEYHLNTETVADMACAYDLPARTEDGMDALAVHAATEEAIDRARTGSGATLLEFVSYRFAGQFEGDSARYQPQEEIDRWWRREPLTVLEALASDHGVDGATLAQVRDEVAVEVEAAFAQAEQDPFPEPEELYEDVYVRYEGSLR